MKMHSTKVKKKTALVIVNFGGPRNLDEIPAFLKSLLTDQDVVRTPFPSLIHNYLFSRVAKKRSKKVALDYQMIGGKSPIYEDTQAVAKQLQNYVPYPIYTFHRYLPETHSNFMREIIEADIDEWKIFPMFPQFSYATSGSIARWFSKKLPSHITNNMFWLKSYPCQKPFIDLFTKRIRNYMTESHILEKDWLLFFSAHGLPKKFVEEGDPYQRECELSYNAIVKNFPKCKSLLAYQSKFGPGQWLKPYTIDICKNIKQISESKKNVLFVPLAFTSDHIETLFEIETEYMPVIKDMGLNAYRLQAFNDKPDWIKAIFDLLSEPCPLLPNQMLVRQK
ncbi:MAG: Ferrochelatase [Chlamydiae bacterium]|nr:Ferrochelatase [Chlamydiota bacterium]